ncbi:stress response protein NST1-like isoform X2 [Belonocnema kinseyi]|uniref:stress response protein NST1-like isoform X2 n=1 Tax=Belonocnema kinseyi TaxID=2817044 RepID=UPI00143D624F|nr:stress response protein NST1-like isoform X2 [Belonocnema kinseyi]
MSRKNKSARTEIISLKKPTALDKVIERVPKPKGAVPNFGLPKWKTIPLVSKIPMVPAPKEFNLNDPCNYEMELPYEGFHDKYLTEFYKRPINIQRMIKLGFVTKNLDAKCSLKDYNMYRKYLKKLHNDSVKKELRREDELFIERKVIKYAEDKEKRDMDRLRKMGTAENAKEKAEKRNKIRERRLKSNIRKLIDRMKQIEETKKEDIRNRIEKNKEKMDKMRQVRNMAAKLERRKLVKMITEWKRKESERKKTRKIRLNKEEQKRKKILHDRWQKKQQLQIKELEKEGFLKHCIEQERQIFIQEYNEKIEKERLRMQNLLEKSKKFVKCYAAKSVSGKIRQTSCKILKLCPETMKSPISGSKNSATIQTKISNERSEDHERTNTGEKKRGKKLKMCDKEMKTKK